MSYQEDLILSIYNRGEPGLAMGNIPPGKGGSPGQPYEAPKEDPKNPYVPAPKPRLAEAPNFPGGGFTTTSGAFVDLSGEAYYLDNGELIPEGGYDPALHGDLIPGGGPGTDRVMNKKNNNMLIAGGKKSDEQRAYEDFVKDSGTQPLDEQLMDMDRGRMGGGLDILDDLLFTDTV